MPVVSLLSASICLLIGLFVYLQGKEKPVNRSFFIFNILIFIWTSGDFVIPLLGLNPLWGLYYDRFTQLGGILIAPWFLVFCLELTGYDIKVIYKLKLFRFFGILSGILICLVPTPLLIERVEVLPFKEIPGKILFVEIATFLASILIGLGHLLKARKTANVIQKTRLTYFSVAILIGILCALVWFVTISFFSTSSTIIIYVFEVTYVIITAYTILRHHLMDINIVLKKTVLYTTLSTSVIGIYIATILVFESLFHNLTGITSLAIRIIAGFVITATFQPLRTRIEILIDKLFFRGRLDHQEAIAEFTRSLVTVLDLRELLNLIMSLSSKFNTRQVAIFLFAEDSAQYKIRASTGLDQITKDIELDAQSDLVRLLISTRKVVLRSKIENTSAGNDYTILHAEIDSLKAAIAIPIFVKDTLKGILLLGEKLSEELYSKEDINMLTTLADEAGIAIDNAQLYEDQKRTYFETVQALAQAIEASDEYTRGHSDRVTNLSIQIARQLKMNRIDIDTLKIASILHDVGKIGIIKEVLNKPDKLNEAEFNIIKMHPALGEEIIAPVAFLAPIKPIVRYHHERFDGRGYPDGLKGEEIPFLSRIIAVADTYDAMTSERPYRPALSTEIALAEIKRCSGTQFDPEIVKAFLELDHAI